MALGERIKTLREERGWSQRGLGRRSKVRYALISELESGKIHWISADNLQKLAKTFGVTMEQLMEGRQSDALEPADMGLIRVETHIGSRNPLGESR